MKALLFAVTACVATAQVPRPAEYPPSFFATREAAITSAEKAFAGGSHQELKIAGRRVLVLYHYASGAFSSDAAIYLEDKKAWRLVAYYAPILNESIVASAEDSTVVLKASDTKRVLLTVAVYPAS